MHCCSSSHNHNTSFLRRPCSQTNRIESFQGNWGIIKTYAIKSKLCNGRWRSIQAVVAAGFHRIEDEVEIETIWNSHCINFTIIRYTRTVIVVSNTIIAIPSMWAVMICSIWTSTVFFEIWHVEECTIDDGRYLFICSLLQFVATWYEMWFCTASVCASATAAHSQTIIQIVFTSDTWMYTYE